MADNLDVNPNTPDVNEFPRIARRIVFNQVKRTLEKTDTHVTFAEDEVYVVWFCFILGGWKALCSTTIPDGRYYEVTYDKVRDKVYLDVYLKIDNVENEVAEIPEYVEPIAPAPEPVAEDPEDVPAEVPTDEEGEEIPQLPLGNVIEYAD